MKLIAIAAILAATWAADPGRAVDGDTLDALVTVWPNMMASIRVRIAGIDAPELRGKCDAEKFKAAAARDSLAAMLAAARVVYLQDVKLDLYGRYLARVVDPNGVDLGKRQIELGHAVASTGARSMDWCTP